MSALLVNLFGGPGCGKSTMAARLFAMLKDEGVSVELALEFAKDLTWERRFVALDCQPYVFVEQLFRLQRLMEHPGIQVVVTDSPLLLSAVYGCQGDWNASFLTGVEQIAASFPQVNFLLGRVKPYDPLGRRQSEQSARSVDYDVIGALRRTGTLYHTVPGDEAGARQALSVILSANWDGGPLF